MEYISLSNFINKVENIINNTIENEQLTTIEAKEGNAVLVSEQQFNCLIEALERSKKDKRNK